MALRQAQRAKALLIMLGIAVTVAACNALLATPEPILRASDDAGDDGRAGDSDTRVDAPLVDAPLVDGPLTDAPLTDSPLEGGPCDGGPCPVLLAQHEANPHGIAVDPGSTGNVYFTNWAYSYQSGGVRLVPKDGSRHAVSLPFPADDSTNNYWPRPNDIVRTPTRVCWTVFVDADYTGGSVACVNPDASGYVTYGGEGSVFGSPWGIGSDGATKVFWVDRFSHDVGFAETTDGGAAGILQLVPSFTESNDIAPIAVAPGPGGRLFWDDGAHVITALSDGTDRRFLPGAPATLSGQANGPIAIDAQWVYWVELQGDGNSSMWRELQTAGQPGTAWACPGYGVCPSKVVDGPYMHSPGNIVVDGGFVYWGNATTGTLMRAKSDGSSVEQLLDGVPSISEVAVDDTAIYFTRGFTGPAGTVGTGLVARIPKPN